MYESAYGPCPNITVYLIRVKLPKEQGLNYMPQIPRAAAILLFGLEVSSNKILAKVSECLPSEKSISANAFS